MKRIAWILLLAVAACARPEPALGLLVSTSGTLADMGAEVLHGWQLALEDVPAAKRPHSFQIDAGSSAVSAVRAYHELVDQGATLVLGPLTTDQAVAVAEAARERRVPFVTPTATGDEVTRDNRWAFRTCAADRDVAKALALFARFELQLARLVVVVDLSSRWSVGLGQAFADAFRQRNGRVVETVAFAPTLGGQSTLLEDLAQVDAEGVLLAVRHDALMPALRGASEATLAKFVLLGVDGWQGPGLAEELAGRARGAYVARHFSTQEPGAADFIAKHREAFDELPGDPAALTYDAARMLLGLWSPEANPDALRRALLEQHHVPGVTGTVRMASDGSPNAKSIVLEQLHDPARSRFLRRLAD
ncbi:MAG: amino acid ABC transporter substrate-binding protein [Planctomycetota bacterium]|nr:MAG: amino acid ABC transporter substrate-binding protein [Planctomycetota bacterium]